MLSPHSPYNQDLHANLTQLVNNARLLWEENRQKQGEFVNLISELQRLQTQVLPQIEAEQNADKLQKARQYLQCEQQKTVQVFETLLEKRSQLTNTFHNGMQLVVDLHQELINNHLFTWQNQQRLNKIGFPHDDAEQKLDELQREFQLLAEQIWQLRTYATYQVDLMSRSPQNNNDQHSPIYAQNLSTIVEHLNNLLKSLTANSFIVSKQPDLILKTGTKFKTEIRLLIGDSLGIRQSLVNTNVTVKIIAEEDAKQLAMGQLDQKNIKVIGDITNAVEKISIDDKGRICAKFDNSKLMKVLPRGKQQGRSSSDQKSSITNTSTTDQKYALYFQISPFQSENLGKMEIWCLSVPLMVTVNVSQDCNVRGPIFWRVAFGGTQKEFGKVWNRNKTKNPETLALSLGQRENVGQNWNQAGIDSDQAVTWDQLYSVLRYQFKEFTGAKRLLSDSDLNYLYEKLFNSSMVNLDAKRNFDQFAKTPLPGVNFSFWDWFYSIMSIIKHKLLKYWEDGWCIGFITKQGANDLLQRSAFLLRFSDTQMGAVSIGFHTTSNPNHLSPFTTKDLELLSISQRIANCPQLQHIECIIGKEGLIPKEQIMEIAKKEEQTNAQTSKSSTGYVHSQIIMVIDSPGYDCGSSGATTPSLFNLSDYSQQSSPGEIPRPNTLEDLGSMDYEIHYGDVNILLGEFVGAWQNPPIAPNLNTPTIQGLLNAPQTFNLNNIPPTDHQGNYLPNNQSPY